jgi:hypothetical protein
MARPALESGAVSMTNRPLFAALPKSCGSKGTHMLSSTPTAATKSFGLISGSFGVSTLFSTSLGGGSFGRAFLRKSIKFFALRMLTRSGVAVSTISSASDRTFRVHGVQVCGKSTTICQELDRATSSRRPTSSSFGVKSRLRSAVAGRRCNRSV